MKTFIEFLEMRIIGGSSADDLKKRGQQFVKDASAELGVGAAVAAGTGGLAAVPAAVGTAATVAGSAVKFAVGAVSDVGRKWRENKAVKQAMELASQRVTQKAQTRDPSLIQRTVDNYVEISDACLAYLTEQEKGQIASNLFQAIKDGSVGFGHAQNLANEMLTNKANQIMQAVSSSRTKVAV
jgi:hypothetical protein